MERFPLLSGNPFRVAGSDSEDNGLKIPENQPKPTKETKQKQGKLPPELEAYRTEAQAFLDGQKQLFALFAKDNSLRFKLGTAFYIDLEKGEVNLDTSWFAKREFSRQQIAWAVFHELSHFRDLAEDPEHMMKKFVEMRRDAQTTGAIMMKKWEAKFGEEDPELIENLKKTKPQQPQRKRVSGKPFPQGPALNTVEEAAYRIHHTFENICDDIFVNANVEHRAPAYEPGTAGGAEVERLYREKLFASKDYRDAPRHLQFMYALLRGEMVPNEEVVVADDVREALDRALTYGGKKMVAQEVVKRHLKPGGRRNMKSSARSAVISHTLEPIFNELLIKDLEEWDPQKPQKQESGESGESDGSGSGLDANPFGEDYDNFEENSPDQISDKDMEDLLKKTIDKKDANDAEEAKRMAQESMTPEQKAKASAQQLAEEWCKKNSVDPMTLEQFRSVEAQVAPYVRELSELWDKIITGSTRELQREVQGHYKTGTELDVQQVIHEWPKIEKSNMEQVRVMKREITAETLVSKPDLIRVRLVGDLSGSMDEDKRKTLEQCFVLLLSSLDDFNARLQLVRGQTKSKLTVDTEAWVFGSQAQKIKTFSADQPGQDSRVETISIFEKLSQSLGSTADHEALSAIADTVTPQERAEILKKKTLEILFEITDGGADDPERSREEVDRLLQDGIVTRAFQIGSVNEEEKQKFNQVWNDGRESDCGEVVGADIAKLIPAVAKALKKLLSSVRL